MEHQCEDINRHQRYRVRGGTSVILDEGGGTVSTAPTDVEGNGRPCSTAGIGSTMSTTVQRVRWYSTGGELHPAPLSSMNELRWSDGSLTACNGGVCNARVSAAKMARREERNEFDDLNVQIPEVCSSFPTLIVGQYARWCTTAVVELMERDGGRAKSKKRSRRFRRVPYFDRNAVVRQTKLCRAAL